MMLASAYLSLTLLVLSAELATPVVAHSSPRSGRVHGRRNGLSRSNDLSNAHDNNVRHYRRNAAPSKSCASRNSTLAAASPSPSSHNKGSKTSTKSAASHSTTSSSAHSHASTQKSASSNNRTASAGSANVEKQQNAGSSSSGYKVVDQWSGKTFFDQGWEFYSGSDPTHGVVDYVSADAAWKDKLIAVDSDSATIAVDSTSNLEWGAPRKSVRITSKKQYDSGLFVFDIASMPHGKATWPAIWTVGPNWPNNGEIDIIEGVNDNVQNQYTLHTSSGCTTDLSNKVSGFLTSSITSKVSNHVCGVNQNSNAGCAFIDSSKASYGSALNAAGGAVFAMLWNEDGIKIWNFPRDSVPKDVSSQAPDPDSWSSKYLKAAWSSSTCKMDKYFKKQSIVVDTTLCGDWAGNVFPGGMSACKSYVMKGTNFKNAAWKINSIAVYQ